MKRRESTRSDDALFQESGDLLIAFKHTLNAIAIADHDGRIIVINPAFTHVTGVPKEVILGHKMTEMVSRGIVPNSSILGTLETGKVSAVQHKTAWGHEVIGISNPVYDGRGALTRVVCNLRNIKELDGVQRDLRGKESIADPPVHIIAESKAMQEVLRLAECAALSDGNVLIQGETGVGKGLIARLIFEKSLRQKTGRFVKVNVSATPSSLFETEFFGYEKGAFTGALTSGKRGFIEMANHGVLFLDEIAELSADLQAKLLTVVEDHQLLRVGGAVPVPIDVRIIAATNQDIGRLRSANRFRNDLYYRLSVIPIYIPPLSDRREDIEAFILHFLEIASRRQHPRKVLSPRLIEYLRKQPWAGNVREIMNTIEYLFVTTGARCELEIADLPPGFGQTPFERVQPYQCNIPIFKIKNGKKLRETVEEYELELVRQAVEEGGTYTDAAHLLGVSVATVHRKIQRLKRSYYPHI